MCFWDMRSLSEEGKKSLSYRRAVDIDTFARMYVGNKIDFIV